jgi:hypothetical protein
MRNRHRNLIWVAIAWGFAVMAATPVRAQDRTTCPDGWYHAVASAPITSGDAALSATQQAFNRARERAHIKALESACQIVVSSERWYSDIASNRFRFQEANTRLQGFVVDDTLLARRQYESPASVGDMPELQIEVEICARCACEPPGSGDQFFNLEVQVGTAERPHVEVLREGEKVCITATPSRDAYLTVLSSFVDESGGLVVTMLYPNAVYPDQELVPAGTPRQFPPSGFRDKLSLEAALLPGRTSSDELVTVIATAEPYRFFPLAEVTAATGPYRQLELDRNGFRDLVTKLVAIDPRRRTIKDYPMRIVSE